ncbi:MAG: response regulator [Treponema sp.]|jgi:signal transduction histidine kinase/DNA-binding NarL/FixJ family response regulator/HPt (histidine-containing phosphotransfer) domain-containing protein|nr:response regulator [Treponema sp.]
MRIKDFFHQYILSEELPLEGRVLNLVCCFGILGAFINALVQIFEGASLLSVLSVFGMIGAAVLMVIISNKFRIYRLGSRLTVILVCYILMPLLFFTNGGIDGGTTGYFVMCMMLIFFVWSGKASIIMVILFMIIAAACYGIQWYFPGLVIPFHLERRRYIDHVQTIYIAGLLLGCVTLYQNLIYIQEKKKAESSARAKTDFLANVSHELRTPLNAIIGLGELELQKHLQGETAENLEKIHTSGKILLSIINDLLDFSKIESGKFELVPSEYMITSVINDTVSLNVVRIGSKPIKFRLTVDETIPERLFGDELRLRQILSNLLSNAFKYTKKGTVDLCFKCDRPLPSAKTVILDCSVTDTGIGIRQEDLRKLFSVYNQVDTRSNRHIEGTGLGLSISKNLVEMMGGTISVQSEFGKGSTFSVRIPQDVINDRPIGSVTARNLENFRFITITRERRKKPRLQLPYARALVVDDVETNLDVAKGMLLPYGLEIDCVSSGPEAIKLVREGRPYQIIFMDHMMPGMDGIEAARIIHNETGVEYAKTVPIIALTANAIAGNDEMFLRNGFQAFLSKPIDTVKLDQILNTWVRNRKKDTLYRSGISAGVDTPAAVPDRQEDAAAAPAGSAAAPDSPAADVLQVLGERVPGIDIGAGLKRFGQNREMYLKILKSFTVNMKEHLDKIRTFAEEDTESYIITVHGIKGSCYGVAAVAAGKMAEELEMAARKRNIDFIRAGHDDFLIAMDRLLAEMNAVLHGGGAAQP